MNFSDVLKDNMIFVSRLYPKLPVRLYNIYFISCFLSPSLKSTSFRREVHKAEPLVRVNKLTTWGRFAQMTWSLQNDSNSILLYVAELWGALLCSIRWPTKKFRILLAVLVIIIDLFFIQVFVSKKKNPKCYH